MRKRSPPALDILKVEASVSPTSDKGLGETAHKDGGGSSASRSLEKIIGKSSSTSLSSSPDRPPIKEAGTKDQSIDQTSTALKGDDIDNSKLEPTTTHPAPVTPSFIGTMLEGHSFTQAPTIPATDTPSAEATYTILTSDLALSQSNINQTSVTPEMSEDLMRTSNDSTREGRSSFSALANWWSGSNHNTKLNHEKIYTHEHGHSVTAFTPSATSTIPSTTPGSPSATAVKPETPDNMEWEPSGPEAVYIQKTVSQNGLSGRRSSSSLPSSLPSSASFPTSMIKHPKLSASMSGRQGSGSSTQDSLTSILWSKLSVTQDNVAKVDSLPITKDSAPGQSSAMDLPQENNSTDANVELMSVNRFDMTPTNSERKRWSLFGYGTKDEGVRNLKKLRKSGDVLIEPESKPSSIKEASTPIAEHDLKTNGSTIEETKYVITKPTVHPVPELQTSASLKTELAHTLDGDGPMAPALVGTTDLSVIVSPGAAISQSTSDSDPLNPSGTVSSMYSWLSIIPGYGNKSQITVTATDSMRASHQITDYKEGERKDVNGNTVNLEIKSSDRTLTQLADEKGAKEGLASKDCRKVGQTFAELRDSENKESSIAKETGKAVASLSKVILKKKNVVVPDYYQQYPDVRQSLIASPASSIDALDLEPDHGRSSSIMKSAVSAVSAISSFLFTKESSSPAKNDAFHRDTSGIKKVVIIGVHGWFPVKLIRTMFGEPTGTSKKFCDEMNSALRDYLKMHNVELGSDDITLIPLEGEGKVMNRVEILYQNLVKNEDWKVALHQADLVLVSTHSQGTPTSTLLIARLIDEGMLRTLESDPKMQRVGILAMAGISHGPFPSLKGNLIVRWFEAEAAQELFEFMDSESEISRKYHEALRVVLTSGIRITLVASLEDQVVPLYSAVMTSVHHPSIVRAVYIDGATYQDDFLTNLISFSLRLRNSGFDDHGVLLHLSEVVAGSIYGEGHSTIYEEREVYMLAIRALLEPPDSLTSEMARSVPILHPFCAKQNLNPFYLPWGMRGVMDEIKALGNDILAKEMERLKKLYDEWNPVSKGHAGIGKRRLASCIRSEITSQPPASESIPDNDTTFVNIKSKSNTSVNFRTAETLPLEISGHRASTLSLLRPLDVASLDKTSSARSIVEPITRYDLILFMVNMSSRTSWEETKRSLLQLDPDWFLGRCAIVVTRVSAVSNYAFDRDDITDFVKEFYEIPILWVALDVDSQASLTALQIIRMLEVSAGYRLWSGNSSLAGLPRSHTAALEIRKGIPCVTKDTAKFARPMELPVVIITELRVGYGTIATPMME
ncbi:hypothetical protein BGX27_009586 [Mortierella sp. AM989]|nr:hypothetical protein BGX27_009586 [Mortierella sp. AM989]